MRTNILYVLGFYHTGSNHNDLQWKEILASVKPNIMPGEDHIIILRLPTISIYFKATRVKMKLVPAIIRPTAVG